MNLTFCKNYKKNDELRASFNALAKNTFGISFESWHELGFWTEKYIPYSFAVEGKVIANVSVNKIDMVIKGERKDLLQIGTVMTHPDFRGQGLSRKLMELVLEEFEGKYDFMYLFANSSVLDFYPKFGFMEVFEHQFSMALQPVRINSSSIKKLNMKEHRDQSFLYKIASERSPVSNAFSATNTEELLMFYCLNVFSDDIYYLEEEECIVIYQKGANEIHLFDVIYRRAVDIARIVSRISDNDINRAVFYFTPELNNNISTEIYKGSEVLFIKPGREAALPERFKHPITSQA